MRVHARWLLIVALLAGIAPIASARPVAAATVQHVTSCSGDDTVAGSLPYIIKIVTQTGDTVVFDQNCTIMLVNTVLINGSNTRVDGSNNPIPPLTNVTIDALATGFVHTVILDGQGTIPVMKTQSQANAGPTVSLNGLTIRKGLESSTGFGGGINIDHGTMTITNSSIVNNHATSAGGGIYNGDGLLTVTNSTISGNTVTSAGQSLGGGIANGANGTLNVMSSTITGNGATTTAINRPPFSAGGGIFDFQATANKVTLTNTIVAGNMPGNCNGTDIAIQSASIASGGHNLIGVNQTDAFCGQDFAGISDGVNNDQVGTDTNPIKPLLGALGDYGGHTQTLPLLPGSPAINRGGATCPIGVATDQRGVSRPQGGACDIGAFESQGFTFTTPTGTPQSTVVSTAFPNALGVTVAANQPGAPFNEPVSGGAITFTIVPAGGAGATFGPKVGCTVSPDMLTAVCALAGGIATSPALTANNTVGPYTATASGAGVAAAGNPTYQLQNVAGITLTAPPLANGTVGAAYSQMLTASGGSGSGYAFSVPPGTLPPGLTLSSAGLIAGTPTQAGPFTFTVMVTDSASGTGNQQYTVTIAPTTTTTAVMSAISPFSAAAQNISLTATISASIPVNEGTVTFTVTQGAATIGSPVTSGTVTNGQATAAFSAPAGMPPGGYTVTAVYNPVAVNPNFTTSMKTGMLTIGAIATTTAVTNATVFFAATAQNVALTATVSAFVSVNEGTVTFTVTQGATTIGTAVTSGTVANGQASATFLLPANTPTGAYTVTALYIPASTNPQFATSTNTGTLTVTTATVTKIVLTSPLAASQIKVGQAVQLTATATLSNGNTVDLTNQVQWTSANASIASVDARGKVTGQSPGGPVTITAAQGAVTGQTQLTVVPLAPIGISVPPAPASRPSGTTSGTPGQSAPGPAPAPSGSSPGGGVAPAPAPSGR